MKLRHLFLAAVAASICLLPASELSADTNYTVRPGESWASITAAQCRQDIQPAALAQYNGASVSSRPAPGTTIRIPDSLSNTRSARLQSFQGNVTVDGRAAQRGQALSAGQTIVTAANSQADVVLDNGSVMRVGANTRLGLTQMALSGRSSNTSTNLQNGSVTMQVTRLNRDSSFSVSTVSAVAGVRGTYFYINYDENSQDVGVACYTGKVIVGRTATDAAGNNSVDPNGSVEVGAGYATTLRGDGSPAERPFPIPGQIQWATDGSSTEAAQ